MAKSKSRRKLSSNAGRNIVNPVARRSLPLRVRSINQIALDTARLFGQDNRTYSPIKTSKPARRVTGFVASKTVQKNKPLRIAKMQFVLPKQVTVCVRRGVRKEVLHALGKTGHGSGVPKRFNSNSKVKC